MSAVPMVRISMGSFGGENDAEAQPQRETAIYNAKR